MAKRKARQVQMSDEAFWAVIEAKIPNFRQRGLGFKEDVITAVLRAAHDHGFETTFAIETAIGWLTQELRGENR